MNKKEILDEIEAIKKDAALDMKIVAELDEISKEIEKEADLDEPAEGVEKVAKLIENGCRVVCVSPIQAPIKGDTSTMTLYKGRYYIVVDANSYPGYLRIAEEDGSDVGIFEVNRFLPDTRAF
jgi:tRNA A58 N-methylase Trm61